MPVAAQHTWPSASGRHGAESHQIQQIHHEPGETKAMLSATWEPQARPAPCQAEIPNRDTGVFRTADGGQMGPEAGLSGRSVSSNPAPSLLNTSGSKTATAASAASHSSCFQHLLGQRASFCSVASSSPVAVQTESNLTDCHSSCSLKKKGEGWAQAAQRLLPSTCFHAGSLQVPHRQFHSEGRVQKDVL